MKKMPPLPNKRLQNNAQQIGLQLVSNQIKLPPRYNSIQRVIRESRKQFQDQSQECQTPQSKSRQNALMKRPMSARQPSNQTKYKSSDSRRSRESKESISSKEGSHKYRHSPHYNKKMRMTMPLITAHSWVLYQMREEKYLSGKSNFKKRQIASLTKIMNLYTIMHILEDYHLVASKIRLNVTKQACTMTGTSAELKPGIEISLQDLFYGMMLPSGNDAAHQIAQIGGAILHAQKEGDLDKNIIYSCQKLNAIAQQNQNVVGIYIHEMNQLARKLGLSRTTWANPHGLSNVNNLSSAEDVAKLCMRAMKSNNFREIVSAKTYNCLYYYQKQLEEGGSQIVKDYLKWQNTNKLLWQGWTGIKTGITPNAGPCLAASVKQIIRGREYEFLVVLIKSDSMEARWGQVKSLVNWIVQDSIYCQT